VHETTLDPIASNAIPSNPIHCAIVIETAADIVDAIAMNAEAGRWSATVGKTIGDKHQVLPFASIK
jgi:hypothetical protein